MRDAILTVVMAALRFPDVFVVPSSNPEGIPFNECYHDAISRSCGFVVLFQTAPNGCQWRTCGDTGQLVGTTLHAWPIVAPGEAAVLHLPDGAVGVMAAYSSAGAAADAFPGYPTFTWDYIRDVMTFPKSAKTESFEKLLKTIDFGQN